MRFAWATLLALALLAGCGGKDDKPEAEKHDHPPPLTLSEAIDMARSRGIPATFDELHQQRDNSLDAGSQAYLALAKLEDSADVQTLVRFVDGQATAADADKALAALADHTAQMEQAALADPYAPPRDYSRGVRLEAPEYGALRAVNATLCARAVRRADSDDQGGAVADLAKAARVVTHAESEGLTIASLLAVECVGTWSRAATKIAEAHPSTHPEIARIAASIPKIDGKPGLEADFALIRATIEDMRSGKASYTEIAGAEEPILVNGRSMDDLLKQDLDLAERHALSYILEAHERWHSRKEILELAHLVAHIAGEETEDQSAMRAFEAMAGTFTMPMKNGEALAQAQLETLRIAIAARALIAKGETPTLESASKAAGCPMADPFTDSPYAFKLEGDKLTVYSVGLDGEDNNGKPYVKGETKGTDVAVTL